MCALRFSVLNNWISGTCWYWWDVISSNTFWTYFIKQIKHKLVQLHLHTSKYIIITIFTHKLNKIHTLCKVHIMYIYQAQWPSWHNRIWFQNRNPFFFAGSPITESLWGNECDVRACHIQMSGRHAMLFLVSTQYRRMNVFVKRKWWLVMSSVWQ